MAEASTESDLDNEGGSGRVDFRAAARRRVEKWASCTEKTFRGPTKEKSAYETYNLSLVNQLLVLHTLHLVTMVSLKELHRIQGLSPDLDLGLERLRMQYFVVEKTIELERSKREAVNTAYLREERSDHNN